MKSAADAHARGKVGSGKLIKARLETLNDCLHITETYLIFIALQCTAVPIAFFLTSPDKVQRTDGSKVRIILQDSWRDEMKELWKVCQRKEVCLTSLIQFVVRVTNLPRFSCYCLFSGPRTSICTLAVWIVCFLFTVRNC